nr:putative phage abortive infection protein [uncultured Undibacterium sp.]
MAIDEVHAQTINDIGLLKRWENFSSKFSVKKTFENLTPKIVLLWFVFFILDTFRSIFFWVSVIAFCIFMIYFSYVAHPGPLVDQNLQSEIQNLVGKVFADLPTKTDRWGQLGDFFGGVLNPLIGLATVFLLVQSVKLQRKELAATRKAMEETKEEMKDQSEQMKLQGFESTFFTWLGAYRSLVTSFEAGSVESVGGLNKLLSRFLNEQETAAQILHFSNNETRDNNKIAEFNNRIINGWRPTEDKYQHFFYPIINSFLELTIWIDANVHLTQEQKRFYINIIISQLSVGELKLILIFTKVKAEIELHEICEKYDVFRNLAATSFILKFLFDMPSRNS